MEVRLEVTHRKANVDGVVLRASTLIGRSTECRLRIASNSVSRRHCLITMDRDRVSVRDLGSSNGTRVDGTLIAPHDDTPLRPGSLLEVGPVRFVVRFVNPGQPATRRPPSDAILSTLEGNAELRPEQDAEDGVSGEAEGDAADEQPGGVHDEVADLGHVAADPPNAEPVVEPPQSEPLRGRPRGLRSLFRFRWRKQKASPGTNSSEMVLETSAAPTDEQAETEALPVTESAGHEESERAGLTDEGIVDLLMDSESDEVRREEDTLSARSDDPDLSDFMNQFDSKDD